jgi:hypothetical protein
MLFSSIIYGRQEAKRWDTTDLKTELSSDGIAEVKGPLEKITERGDASELSQADARFFQSHTFQQWPDLAWEIGPAGAGKYIVKAEGLRKRKL